MKTYHFLSLTFCISLLLSNPALSFDSNAAQQQAQQQKKQYKKMKALIREIHECWQAAHSKFVTLMEQANYVPSSELVQVHAQELEALRERCLALEKFYDHTYATHISQENKG